MFLPSPTRIPLLSLHSGFVFRRLSSFLFPFRFRVIVLLQLRRIIISSILIIYYKRDVIVLRYAPGLFQAYFLCLSLFSPFITKLLKGAIFRLKNIFTKLLLPPQKCAALGGLLVRLVVKPALCDPDFILRLQENEIYRKHLVHMSPYNKTVADGKKHKKMH